MTPLVEVDHVSVTVGRHGPRIVDDVTFSLEAGEILGIVGESGSGKTTLGLALLGHGRDGAVIASGDVRINGRSMVAGSAAEIARRRGELVAYVPQDPGTSLNPALRIGTQLREVVELGDAPLKRSTVTERILRSLDEMGLPADESFLRRYPHQLSGGQQQRVLLSLAFLREPLVVVLDEPTTGLDVTTQARVLDTVRSACERHHTAAVLVTHDLDVVASLARRVLVLYGGRICELSPSTQLFDAPAHQYTAALLAAAPSLGDDTALLGIPGRPPRLTEIGAGCAFAARCPAAAEACAVQPLATQRPDGRLVHCHHPLTGPLAPPPRSTHRVGTTKRGDVGLVATGLRAAYDRHEVVHGVDLQVFPGECVALVGESGSGKTTISQCIAGLREPTGGDIVLDGVPLARAARDRSLANRRALQYVFQNPFGSLNPRKTVAQLVDEPYQLLGIPDRDAGAWLERVHLGRHILRQRPRGLSGGERQRVAIARALATRPRYLICDEVTSALDVSIQASIVELLRELQEQTGIGLLFVTHNLPLVSAIADRIVVLRDGAVVEMGDAATVLHEPTTAYASELLASVPSRTPARS